MIRKVSSANYSMNKHLEEIHSYVNINYLTKVL